MNGEKDWHQSMTVWGGILATISPFIANLPIGHDLAVAVAGVVASIGGLAAVIGRMRATTAIAAPAPPTLKP